ncbi:MAG TPA: putative protein N(5)-glutamine methyltransferase [Jatrophihabitans sp.]|nr:putative protein N(5)-glutamine methyltransferase [Jatrophihabitans sp.]
MSDADELTAQLRRAGCVFAEEEAAVLRAAASSPAELTMLTERRVAGEPLEHVVGWVLFCGRRIRLEPGVFVPRQRTTLMARLAVARLPAGGTLVELCCGAAAVATVAVASIENVQVWAADCDPVAVRSASLNLQPDRVLLGDLYEPLPAGLRGRVDVLAANAPYVPSEAIALMPREAQGYEAVVALDGGRDGLQVLRRVLDGAADWLSPAGSLLVEAGSDQLSQLAEHAGRQNLHATIHTDEDVAGIVVELRRR